MSVSGGKETAVSILIALGTCNRSKLTTPPLRRKENEMTDSDLEKWREWSRIDDRFEKFVLSDIRQMIGEIDRLRRDKTHLEGLVEGYKRIARSA